MDMLIPASKIANQNTGEMVGGGGPGKYRTLWQIRHQYVPVQGQRLHGFGEGGAVTVPGPAEVLHVREP